MPSAGYGRQDNALAAALLVIAWILFTTEIIIARIVSAELSIPQITLARLATQLVVLAPFVLWRLRPVFTTNRLPLHVVRAIASATAMTLYYFAFANLPVAQATTLTFTQAMWLTLLAALILGEQIGWRRIGATIAGFTGVLIVTRPGFGAFEPAMLFAISGALVGAAVMLLTRLLAGTESRLTIMSYVGLFGTSIMIMPALLTWQPITSAHVPMLLAIGLFGTAGQFLMVGAFRLGEASALAPVDYVRLVFAVIGGYLVFREIPDLWTICGSAVIIASALYITHREHLIARTRLAA